MKKIAVLGSTGSIGTQALSVVSSHPEEFSVSVLGANSSDELLEKQIKEYSPSLAVLADEAAYKRLKSRYHGKTELAGGREAFIEAAAGEGDILLTSMMGFAGLQPTIRAIEAGKTIALANKETLVVAGRIVTRLAKEKGVKILPVDSEHSAFFQCLEGNHSEISRLLLTASGGPFRGKKREDLRFVSQKEVLAHPTWNMGKKITVDSATLVNKGLEAIEAKWLYNVDFDKIEVVVHPQSIIHSMVEFVDGAVLAQMATPDMRLPIQYAFSYPNRLPTFLPSLNFTQIQNLTFEKPDIQTFRGLYLATEAGKIGGSMPTVMNAANEVAVSLFLKNAIGFLEIYDIIEETMLRSAPIPYPTLEELIEIDAMTRSVAMSIPSEGYTYMGNGFSFAKV